MKKILVLASALLAIALLLTVFVSCTDDQKKDESKTPAEATQTADAGKGSGATQPGGAETTKSGLEFGEDGEAATLNWDD